jgi:hypothetical protein
VCGVGEEAWSVRLGRHVGESEDNVSMEDEVCICICMCMCMCMWGGDRARGEAETM